MTIDDAIKEESRMVEDIEWRLNKNYDNWLIQYNEREKKEMLVTQNYHIQVEKWLQELKKYRRLKEHIRGFDFKIRGKKENETIYEMIDFLIDDLIKDQKGKEV